MKHLFTLCLLAFLMLCSLNSTAQATSETKAKAADNNKNTNAVAPHNISMQGAYAMVRQIANDGTKDSLTGTEQLKIYTDRYLMYAHPIAGDSLADYGIGTYEIRDNKVIEYIFHTASGGAQKDTFELRIDKTADGYTQVFDIPEYLGRKWTVREEYKSVGKAVATPLDGAWKQTKSQYITKDGNTITNNNPTQYKVYQSGYFIWANTVADSITNKPVSYYGYGTFAMDGNNRSTEVNTSSSYKTALVGQPVSLQLEFMGKDAYQQTILGTSGDRSIEVYQRLK